MYNNKPLVREGNFLFYGNPEDKLILFMNILSSKEQNGLNVATKVLVQIQKTDDNISYMDKIVKQCEKGTFYDAFEIGVIWLERELAKLK